MTIHRLLVLAATGIFREDGQPWSAMPTDLHAARMDAVKQSLNDENARTVLDLGCGSGELMAFLLADGSFDRVVGIDICPSALAAAEHRLSQWLGRPDAPADLIELSFTRRDRRLEGWDAAVMLETIEHLEPGRLSCMEHAVFAAHRPATVLITTPNADYNEIYGLPPGAFRHPDHRFEWGRSRFRAWAWGVARRHGYGVRFRGIGDNDALLGSPTQMAHFSLA